MLRSEDQLGTGLETQGSLPVGRDVCGPCRQGRASLGGGTQDQWEAVEQAGGWGRPMEWQPGVLSWMRETAEGQGREKMTKELRCREPRGRQTEPEERRKQEAGSERLRWEEE